MASVLSETVTCARHCDIMVRWVYQRTEIKCFCTVFQKVCFLHYIGVNLCFPTTRKINKWKKCGLGVTTT